MPHYDPQQTGLIHKLNQSVHEHVGQKLTDIYWVLTFDNQDGRSRQALHFSVNNTHILPAIAQLNVTNHQIS